MPCDLTQSICEVFGEIERHANCPSVRMSPSPNTLFQQLGGQAAVEAAVDNFYRKVLTDDRVSRFFEGIDMDRQIAKQKGFLTMAFGGPNNYSGKDMRTGHAHLVKMGLNDSHVDAIIELLGQTLKEMGVADSLISQVAAIAESTRNDVLNR
jgi:hemoglobin